MPKRQRGSLRRFVGIAALAACSANIAACQGRGSVSPGPHVEMVTIGTGPAAPAPVAGHPRLLVTETDVPRLREWASAANPVYTDGLAVVAANAIEAMDDGRVPGDDGGSDAYEEYPVELYAELFAFMSLVDPDADARHDFGRRARDLFMYFIAQAESGPGGDDEPFRDPDFATYDRSRWHGDAWGLTVDWAYPYFTAADRARIRAVFLRWSDEQYSAYPIDFLNGPVPSPDGPFDDPALVQDIASVRAALNNYYIAHARNLGLMALALDDVDDPGGQLHAHLDSTIGAWLYTIDHALRTQASGGLDPEGFQYGPDSLGRLLELLVALRTAGEDDPAVRGRQVSIGDNPFWSNVIPALLHSLPPHASAASDGTPIWEAALFGSAEHYGAPDFITSLGPLALYARGVDDRATLNAIRWIETNVPPGGPQGLLDRVANTEDFMSSILYFLTFDPGAPSPSDPRPLDPTAYFAGGLNHVFARTCWCDDARWFTYSLEWKGIDHQRGDANDFGFWRNGEWLTKQRTGYSSTGSFSDYHNTLTIQNNPLVDESDERFVELSDRGDQWSSEPAGDPRLVAHSETDDYVYATGDATELYNAGRPGVDDVTHASRSIVWLPPDHVVVYDRAETGHDGRFKRFWLQLPANADISDGVATVSTPGGQQLFATTLLPERAKISVEQDEDDVGDPTEDDPMRFRLRVEAQGDPASVRFLHVIQGADAGTPRDPTWYVQSSEGAAFDGAAVAGTLVLFPVALGETIGSVEVVLPTGVDQVIVTGLEPDTGYTVEGRGDRLTIAAGGTTMADPGGVLSWRGDESAG